MRPLKAVYRALPDAESQRVELRLGPQWVQVRGDFVRVWPRRDVRVEGFAEGTALLFPDGSRCETALRLDERTNALAPASEAVSAPTVGDQVVRLSQREVRRILLCSLLIAAALAAATFIVLRLRQA